jgi:hypothetical protein
MQKRRGGPLLPVTAADASKRQTRSTRARRTKQSSADMFGLGKLLLGILGIGIIVVTFQRSSLMKRGRGDDSETGIEEVEEVQPLPLDEFTSLEYALQNSQLVALYFAASWCPMSTPVTNMLDEKFRDVLLPPPPPGAKPKRLLQRHGLALVYVSSDTSVEEMQAYMRTNWMAVPYDSEDRDHLKRKFKTCAKRELEALGIERQYEIPTLIILSGDSHQVLTYEGTADIKEYGAEAVDHWLELDRLALALEAKYDTI